MPTDENNETSADELKNQCWMKVNRWDLSFATDYKAK